MFSRIIKLTLISLLVFLDVASPYGCNRTYKPCVAFYVEIDYPLEDGHNFDRVNYGGTERVLNKTATVEEPIIRANFPSDEYQILGWQIYVGRGEQGAEFVDVTFPYELKASDFYGYYYGYHNVAVFRAIVEKIEQQ